MLTDVIKGIVHPKWKIMSLFTHPHLIPHLYVCFSGLNTKENILKNTGNQTVDGSHWLPSCGWGLDMEVSGYCQWNCLFLQKEPNYSKYLLLCSSEARNSYRFGASEEWKWWQNVHFGANCLFNVSFYLFKDARASYDVNGNDPDPTPRYDATNENKSVHFSLRMFWF